MEVGCVVVVVVEVGVGVSEGDGADSTSLDSIIRGHTERTRRIPKGE